MPWYDPLMFWRSDAVEEPTEADVVPVPSLFRQDSFENSVTGLGTDRDYVTGSSVRRTTTKSLADLTSMYRFDGYLRRFVDIVPDQATRKSWKIVVKSEEEGKADETLMEEEDKRLCTNENVGDALRWARLYGGSVLAIINGDSEMAEPMDPENPGTILNLAVFDRRELSAMTWNDNIASPHFREVEEWQLSPSVVGSSGFTGGIIHRSRVIYFPGAKLPPSVRAEQNGFDDSVVESVYKQLRNKSVLDDQMARLSYDARVRALKLRGLDSTGLSDVKTALMDRAKLIAQTINLTGVMLLLEGEEFTSQIDNVSGWAQLDDKARQALSAVTATPQTILFGDSPSGLNTDGKSGRNNFGDVIAAIQNHLLRKRLERLYTILINSVGRGSDKWALEFNPIFEITEQESANLRKTHAETDQIYVTTGVLAADDVARSRFSERGWEADIRAVDIEEVSAREEAADLQAEIDEMREVAEADRGSAAEE